MERIPSAVFLVQCEDRRGLVAKISSFFAERGFNILSCEQSIDAQAGRFFLRIHVDLADLRSSRAELEEAFGELANPLELEWSAHYTDRQQRVAVLVSRASHCLYDLVLRQQAGELDCEIPVILSNHPHLEEAAGRFRIPYHCLPITPETKPEQEAAVEELLRRYHVDLVVLARYMQILSPELVDRWPHQIINIHHGFLPAFQGAQPYRRAYDHGVKMIGATAHYVIAELDEGPILEQDVERVSHRHSPGEMVQIGRDIERIVLARAVRAHLEHRVIVHGRRTVVFSAGL